ncbi:MAG: YigZ family protein [Anaerococcus vaginalis]|nr:YigZ family protein [Anaerococcus vaginalis]
MKDISRKISQNYKTIKGEIKDEFEIEKSVFITNIKYVESEDEALAFIEKIKEKYKDANHNCHAYIINEKPEIKRYSDDGEPQGSAGLPMLSVLEKEELFNLVAVVTRYFGGKKLGKGGLVRAYTKGVSDCLDGKITYRKIFIESKITFDYNLLGIIENFLNEKNYIIIEKNFLENVRINLYIRKDEFENFKKKLIDMTSSNIKIEKLDEIMLYED